MDAGFLNFHKEEDFTSYFLDPCGDDSHSYDGVAGDGASKYDWDWEHEQELNGDIGLIPVSNQTADFCPLSSSPPSNEEFAKMMMNDWHQLVSLDQVTGDLAVDVDITPISPDGFDIAKYVEKPDPPKVHVGGKRIDMARRMYVVESGDEEESEIEDDTEEEEVEKEVNVVDDDDEDAPIDVETVTEHVSHPVLQAGDLDTLLEQFEATENTNLELQKTLTVQNVCEIIPQETVSNSVSTNEAQSEESDLEGVKYVSPNKLKLISPIKSPVKRPSAANSTPKKLPTETEQEAPKKEPEENFAAPTKDQSKNKQILDSLPTELINRIRQSSKRKPVPVIEPLVPKKKRQTTAPVAPKEQPSVVQLDHDYCTSTPRKDSGFSSCEEDDRSILRSQPTVKNADGKLMVSLLKSNTIKKKLNLEEYKRRLLQGKSRASSGGNSPAPDEDENARRLKHQEMLMKMAEEIIAQQQQNKSGEIVEVKKEEVESKPADIPSNIIKKTLVSVGTNTEESWGHLEQILQSTRIKISPNSLISSIVEHLPKVKPVITKQVEHGEDKTIVYLDRNIAPPETTTVHVQTVYGGTRRRRRRRSSSGSSSTSTSSESCSSSTSRESSRSRTPSPVRRRQKEQLKEVEERRVIYVGRIPEYATRDELRRRFGKFGPITNVSVHFRRRADNYGFVTFMHKEDAYQAVEHGNDDPDLPAYDLSFGGRRIFCQTTYSDLDDVKDDAGYWSPITGSIVNPQENTFDVLLREAQEKLKKRQL